MFRKSIFCTLAAVLAIVGLLHSQQPPGDVPFPKQGEFYFVRTEYIDRPGLRRGFSRGWWRQDWPEADVHFTQGIRRLTRIDIGEPRHLPLTDDRVFDHPWIYATQVGYWDLKDPEITRLREYLLRGGFLVVDDFYGEQDWAVFVDTVQRMFPDLSIVDIKDDEPVMHVVYDIKERVFIPGLRHLRRSPGGFSGVQPQATHPEWKGVYDTSGRLIIAINFQMDVGDAWEHADWPEYPEQMTALAYRFGINYIVYAMTH